MVRLLALTGHAGKPVLAAGHAGRFGEQNPLILGSFHTYGNLQFLSAHIA